MHRIHITSFNPSYVGFFDKRVNVSQEDGKDISFNPSYVGFFDKSKEKAIFYLKELQFQSFLCWIFR